MKEMKQSNLRYDCRYIYFDATLTLSDTDRDSLPSAVPGQKWAERARMEMMGVMHAPTVQNLMVSVFFFGTR